MNLSAIYCRVSTEDQESHWSSLPYQMEACLQFAKENNLKIGTRKNEEPAIFLEQFSWGFYDRPQLAELLSLVKSGHISSVIFTKRDRIWRDQFVYQKIKKEIEEAGGKMYFAEEKLTGDSAIDGFMWSTIIGFAEWEREQIKRRTHSGKIQHSRENKWVFAIPFWYIKNPTTKALEIYEDEAKIVRYIFDLYLWDSYSIESLAKHLTEENISPSSLSNKSTETQKWVLKLRKNASYKWIPSTIYRIFEKSELYSGTYTAFRNEYKKIGNKTILIWERPKEDWIMMTVPPIISKEEADIINEKLAYNKRFAVRWTNQAYLLRGKLMCSCEPGLHNMIGNSRMKRKIRVDGSVYEYEKIEYRCSLRTKAKVDDDRRCRNTILSRKVESVVIDTIKELFTNPETVFDYESIKYGWEDNEWDGPIRYLELKEKLENMISKIERAEELFIDGLITKDRLRGMKENLEIEKEELIRNIIKEEKYLHREAFMDSMIESWEDMRKEFYGIVEEFFHIGKSEQIREIIDILIDQVILSPDKSKSLIIRLKIPFDISLSDRYYDDEKILWTDEYGKNHEIMTIDKLVPLKLSLWELHEPIESKEVVFESEKKKDDDSDKKGKWWSGWWSSPITWAIEKMIEFVERVKCKFSFESHQFLIKNKK